MDKWLNHPTALKIISLLLAVLLWAVVHIDPETSPQTATSSTDTKIIEAISIMPVGLDTERFTLTAMEPTVARLVVEGRITHLFAASNDQYIVNVDLSNVKPGIHELPLTVKLPKGIQKVELSPQLVTVRVEEIVTKDYDVQVITQGSPVEGLVVGTPAVMSEGGSKVKVTLPSDDMSQVGSVVANVDISGADKTVVNKKAKVVVYDTQGNEMSGAVVVPDSIHVEVPVTWPNKQVPIQIRYSGTLPEGMSIVSVKPEVNQTTVYADKAELDNITIFDGYVVDLSKIKQSGTYKVKAAAVDGVKSVSPAEISVQVNVESSITKTMSALPIHLQGTSKGTDVKIVSPASGRMDLIVSGSESALAELKASNIQITANIDDLDAGTHTLPLEVELPPHVFPVSSSEQQLTVVVEVMAQETPGSGSGEETDDQEVIGRPEEEESPPPDDSNGEGEP
ncbi:CdaR family protein [Paenibacillus sp. IITD108]|uniref:CdaR family protein n=1 Tax=Paenibacillus sp. IITD108 TaxID=3116649 RepID=UPI002F404024